MIQGLSKYEDDIKLHFSDEDIKWIRYNLQLPILTEIIVEIEESIRDDLSYNVVFRDLYNTTFNIINSNGYDFSERNIENMMGRFIVTKSWMNGLYRRAKFGRSLNETTF